MYLFYLLIAVMLLDQHWFWGMEILPTFTVVKILGIVCFVGALMKAVAGGVRAKSYTNIPALRWFAGALILFSIGAFRSEAATASAAYSHLASIVILFCTVLAMVDTPTRVHRTILVAIGAAAFASLYTIRGGFGAQAAGGFRPSGLFTDSNYYALLVDLWVPVAFLLTSNKRPTWERLFCFGCLASILMGTIFAASRGGMLGLGFAVVFLIVRSRNSMRNFAVLAVLVAPLVIFTPSSLIRRIKDPASGDQQAMDLRLWAWKGGLNMVKEHPLLGVGMHNFKSQVVQYENPEEKVESLAHNSYLEIAAEDGVPALILYIGLLGVTFVSLGRTRQQLAAAKIPLFPELALGLQAGLLSYIVSSFFLSAWWEKSVWLLLFLAVCLQQLTRQMLKARLRQHRQETPTPEMDPVYS